VNALDHDGRFPMAAFNPTIEIIPTRWPLGSFGHCVAV
jgi:hypothetical protein